MKFWQLIFFVSLFAGLAGAGVDPIGGESLVQVESVKNLGLSASDERRSVIEVRWRMDESFNRQISSFNLTLQVRYADGAVVLFDQSVDSSSRSHQFEVPTLHYVRGSKPAFIQSLHGEVHIVPATTRHQHFSAIKRRQI